jgi:EF-P beta-lysylation protein EpmB
MEIWKSILKNNFHRVDSLLDFLLFDPAKRQHVLEKSRFCLNLPRRIAEKIAKNCLDDPLFLQFVPLKKELDKVDNARTDPVEDRCFQKTSHLLQKYKGRVLLITSGACAMHCRFCFRQNYDYDSSERTFEEELTLIENDSSLHEVILSGGDPLSLSDATLASLLTKLDNIPHIQLIRFHTRFPIGIPERISPSLLKILQGVQKQILFMLHINHQQELDKDILAAMQKLQALRIPILSQTVLLKGVNDSVEALKNLFLSLVSTGILPYYLHAFDPIQGAMHFDQPLEHGSFLIEELRKELPGYAIPRFVKEIPGSSHKTPLPLLS